MRVFVSIWVLCLFLLPVGVRAQPVPQDTCLECHLEIPDEPSQSWKDDIHAEAGITCTSCHGGDSTANESEAAKRKGTNFRGKFSPKEILSLCGDCHSNAEYMREQNPLLPVDQLDKYYTSQHGKLLAQGEEKVAQCGSCHGIHGVRKSNDAKSPVYALNVPKMCAQCHADAEYMSDFDIPTDQYDEYVQSVHGKALLEKNDIRGAPACNDCHGNHGAVAPTVTAITNICGTCHAHNAELFLASPLAPAFEEKSLADCIACHEKHQILHTSDDWLGDEPGKVCAKCHKKGDKGAEVALYFSETLADVRKSFAEVERRLHEAEIKGVDITEGEDYVQAAHQALLQTRTLIHSFSKPIVEDKVREIQENQIAAVEVAEGALEEFDSRRRGLAISTLLLLLITIGVGVKIRTLPPV